MNSTTDSCDLLLVGGGHANLAVVDFLSRRSLNGIRVCMLSPQALTPYSGALAGCISGQLEKRQMQVNLARQLQCAGVDWICDELAHLDPGNNLATTRRGKRISFRVMALNTGSTPAVHAIDGAEQAVAVKPVDRLLDSWQQFEQDILSRSLTVRHIGFIGAGVAGVELALAMATRISSLCRQRAMHGIQAQIHLYGPEPALLPEFPVSFRHRVRHALKQAGIIYHPHSRVSGCTDNVIQCVNGHRQACDLVILSTQPGAPEWPEQAGLETDSHGFIRVNSHLQSCSHPHVFAAGDLAAPAGATHPKSGVYAVRQGPVLARNLWHYLHDAPLQPYRPQSRALTIIGTGRAHAIATRGNWSLEGRWVWWWKRWLDSRFVRRYGVSR